MSQEYKDISTQTETFARRVHRLTNYIQRAAQAGQGSVLFAVFLSMPFLQIAEKHLQQELEEQGFRVQKAYAEEMPSGKLVSSLTERISFSSEVLFVFNLEKAGQEGLYSLNYQRETLVQVPLRTVFFLREAELLDISQKAPDFWAFRHRTVYFPETPYQPAKFLQLLHDNYSNISSDSREELENKLELRKKMLVGLPEDAYDARINLMLEIGKLQRSIWDFDSAQTELESALELFPWSCDQKFNKSNILYEIGVVFLYMSRYEEGIDNIETALEIHRQIGDRQRKVFDLLNLGLAYSGLDQQEEAIDYSQAALEISRELGDRMGQGIGFGTLGVAFKELGEKAKAKGSLEQALAIGKEIKHTQFIHLCQEMLARLESRGATNVLL